MSLKIILSRSIPTIYLLSLIMIVMGSAIWSDGSILLLDYFAGPFRPINWFETAWYWIPQIFVNIFGFDLGTKLCFFLILFLAGYLGILFARYVATRWFPQNELPLSIIASTFFVLNPFAYERMMTQPTIYLAIILVGYIIYFLLSEIGFWKKYIIIGLCGGMAVQIALHTSYMILLIMMLSLLIIRCDKKVLLGMVFAGISMIILNLNWIVAPYFQTTNRISLISGFTPEHLTAFATQALAPMNVWFTNLSLYGFWGEQYANHFIKASIFSPYWYMGAITLGIMLFIGIINVFSRNDKTTRKQTLFFIILGFVALILGIGIASPALKGVTLWMIDHVPFWIGYREPQKWIGLLMIAEGFFLFIGLGYILKKYATDTLNTVLLTIMTLIVIGVLCPASLFGYQKQLRTTVIPSDLYDARTKLMKSYQSGDPIKVLILPSDWYIGCPWTGVATTDNPITHLLAPIPTRISRTVKVGDNFTATVPTDQESQAIDAFVAGHNYTSIQGFSFTHILLAKGCGDDHGIKYRWLDTIQECKKTHESQNAILYTCNIP